MTNQLAPSSGAESSPLPTEVVVGEAAPNLFAHTDPSNGDPHAVKLRVSPKVRGRVAQPRDMRWQRVTDELTGADWEVRSFPCGEVCHCAAEARKVDQ